MCYNGRFFDYEIISINLNFDILFIRIKFFVIGLLELILYQAGGA